MKKETEKSDKRLNSIAQKLKQMRIDKGYSSYEAFAWDNGINRVQYWRIEKGSNITLKSLLNVLDIHKMKLSEFCKDID